MRLRQILLTSTALLTLGALPAVGGPDGPAVVGGTATVSGAGSANVNVNQTSARAIINWNTFNIGAGETTTFVQPNSSSVALNRVTGGWGPSTINGALTANGHVFVINRDGVLVGPSGVINTAGFLATTNDIKNSDFMAGRYNFSIPGRPDASIVNQGNITAASGGFAALVAPGVRNTGTITATLGTVALASGNVFTLDFYGDKLIQLSPTDQIAGKVIDVQTGKPLTALVSNTGKLSANGGRVELTAAAARAVVDSVINNKGVIEANSVGMRNGRIVLGAATGASKPAGAPKQTVKLSGTISAAGKAKGTKGGTVVVTGEDIQVTGARIDVSGDTGGGKVLLGGDWGGGHPQSGLVNNPSAALESYTIANATTLSVDATTTINASATGNGNGGKVILWSNVQTTFAGTIFARGGDASGDGGFVEVSGKQQLAFTGNVDTRAPNGAAGTLLLDPADYTIDADNVGTIISNLGSGNVVIQTSAAGTGGVGDIFVNAPVTWSGGNNLTLSAYRNIDVNANITNITGGAAVVLRADNTGTGAGTVNFASKGVTVSTSGAVSIFYNPSGNDNTTVNALSYTTTTDYSGNIAGGATLASYMLVNTVYDLQNVQNNLSGTYALGRDIDASATANWNDGTGFATIGHIGNGGFTGTFDGSNYTISGLKIAPTNGFNNDIGLFGTIFGSVSNLNLTGVSITADPNVTGPGQFVGALAGSNGGVVTNVHVSGTVSGVPLNADHQSINLSGVIIGGLIGQNGVFGPNGSTGRIVNASANVTVTAGDGIGTGCNGTGTGTCSFNIVGGLVGSNSGPVTSATPNAQSTIQDSQALGTVSGGAFTFVGGLVGQNGYLGFGDVTPGAGKVASTTQPGSESPCQTGAAYSCANVAVSVGSQGTGGGLVGSNAGQIVNTFALGAVTGASGVPNQNNSGQSSTILGGLVGQNQGTITTSFARGYVGVKGIPTESGTIYLNTQWLRAGGLVGDSSGRIENSFATGTVRTGDNGNAGGLVGQLNHNDQFCSTCLNPLGASNDGIVTGSWSSGAVTVGAVSAGGGLVGISNGTVTNSYTTTTSTVIGDHDSVLGGLAGVNGGDDGSATVLNSTAAGSAVSTGPNSVVGGLVGFNVGTVQDSHVTSPTVAGTSNSFLGGFVGINMGAVIDSTTTAAVTASGSGNVMGGFVGVNFGTIDPSSSSGNVDGSHGSNIVGGFAGANAGFTNPDFVNQIPGSSFPFGSIVDSSGSGGASGGPGSTVGPQVGVTFPTSGLPAYPSIVNTCDAGACFALLSGILGAPPGFDIPNVPSQLLVVQNNNQYNPPPGPAPDLVNMTALNQPPPPPPPASGSSTAQSGPVPGGPINNPERLNAGDGRYFYLPPVEETRRVVDEVVVQLPCDASQTELNAALTALRLSVLNSECLAGNNAIYRLRTGDNRQVAAVIRALANRRIFVSGQANYTYRLSQDPASAPATATPTEGDPSQYVLDKLRLSDIHRTLRATNVPIAVIDSEIDGTHPDLVGVIFNRYDATGVEEKPHPHGTGMAGAIASHRRLMGIAPGARIFAIRAFSSKAASAESTTFNILKGLDYAVKNNVRIVNMSFAGPRDPSLERALKVAHDKGVILIAAAGNAGPKSPPLYPAADKNVIAVTATDIDDKLFSGANRGGYISVAAPGVDILVPAPDSAYQMTTGTSVATAHVSGIVALMLERNPRLMPDDVKRILTASAKRLGPNDQFGAGLIDPAKALQLAAPRTTEAAPPVRR